MRQARNHRAFRAAELNRDPSLSSPAAQGIKQDDDTKLLADSDDARERDPPAVSSSHPNTRLGLGCSIRAANYFAA